MKIIKFVIKDINPGRLYEELKAAGIRPEGLLWAGFDHTSDRLMSPFAETRVIATSTGQPDVTAEPGELHFRYPSDPGAPLDALLTAHDATVLSTNQTNSDVDIAVIPILVDRYQNWDSLSTAQKDNVLKQLVRVVARLLDSSQDV